jgi:hypothetical protein
VTTWPPPAPTPSDLLLALRAHMKKAVDDGVDISAAVKSF